MVRPLKNFVMAYKFVDTGFNGQGLVISLLD